VTSLVAMRTAVGLVGILVFAFGMRLDSSPVRWVGIGVLGVALLLRFFDPARRR